MFNKSFKARIEGFRCGIRRQTGNNEDQRYVQVPFLFEFTSELASEIGGPAPRVLELVSTSFDAGSVGAVPIGLNSRAVNVRIRLGNKHHVIQDTISLRVRVMPPTGKNISPMLEAKLSFLGGENDVAMLWENMGRQVSVKMDREQLELPGMGEDDQDEPEQEQAMA